MSHVVQFSELVEDRVVARASALPEIVALLEPLGVRFERWTADVQLGDDSSSEQILAAYARDIERLKREHGYLSADVVRLKRVAGDDEWGKKAHAARAKFFDEHTHAEDEVRFFVEGSGMFCLHLQGKVTFIVCERGDLLSVPAGTRHWFDMGSEPAFCAIRLFGSEAGWVANFTGDNLSRRFANYDDVRQNFL